VSIHCTQDSISEILIIANAKYYDNFKKYTDIFYRDVYYFPEIQNIAGLLIFMGREAEGIVGA
jgi:hypothetical protein